MLLAEADVEELEARYDMESEQQQQQIDLQYRKIQSLEGQLESLSEEKDADASYVKERVDKARQRRAKAKAASAKVMEEYGDG